MPQTYTIDFQVTGQSALQKALLGNAAGAMAAAQAMNQLAASVQALRSAQGGAGGAIRIGGGSSSLRLPRQPKPPPSFGTQLMNVLKTSRFGAGGLMPLVGRTMSLLGPVGTVVGGIVGAVAAASKALYDMAEGAAEAARSLSELAFAGGGSGMETGRLAGMASAIGLSPGAMGGMAQSFNSRITSDPYAIGYAAQAGIQNAPGAFGDQDWSKNLLKMVTYLRSIKDNQERIRVARATGTEGLLPLTQLSAGQFGHIGEDAAATSAVFNPQFARQSADFLASVSRVSDGMRNLLASLSGPIMDDMTTLFNGLATSLNNFATFLAHNQAGVTAFFKTLEMIFAPGFAMGSTIAEMLNPQASATDKNTAALKQNTDALGIMQRQYGHGERTDAAIPRGIGMGSGFALRQSLRVQAAQLGAFG